MEHPRLNIRSCTEAWFHATKVNADKIIRETAGKQLTDPNLAQALSTGPISNLGFGR